MASKGQKFSKYSNNLRAEVVGELSKGKSYTELSRLYNIPTKTISTWQQKLRHPEKYINQGRKRGRLSEKNLTKEDWRERYEILKNTRPSSRHNERESNIYKFI